MADDANEDAETRRRKKIKFWRSLVAYWIFGLTNNYGYVIMLSAAHDILTDIRKQEDKIAGKEQIYYSMSDRNCNYMSTGVILLADIIPCFFVKIIVPYLPFHVNIRIIICIALSVASFVVEAYAETKFIAIFGVVLTSFSSGLGEISFLQYTSFFNINVLSTWSSGTGGAGILGALSYALLAYFGRKMALLLMVFVPFLMGVGFWIVLPHPESDNAQIILDRDVKSLASYYNLRKKIMEKLKMLPGLTKYIAPLAFVYFFEYFINQGLFELIYIKGTMLSRADQYRWFQVDYQIGVFISRSSVNIIHLRHIWIMAVLQFINVLIFIFEAIYGFCSSIWIIIIFILWEGLLGGAAYVNTYYRITYEVPGNQLQFSLSATSLSDSIGITLAGLIAIPVHNKICDLDKPPRTS